MALNLGDIIVRLGLDTAQFTRDMRAAQRTMQGAGAGMRQAGTALTASVTLPILAVGAAALKFAADFDAAMSQSVAIMAEFSSRSELTMEGQAALRGEMEEVARTVAKDLNLAATDAAKSFFFLASAGLSAEQSIAALPQVAAFAKAGMFDFALATDLATDAQSALGLSVNDAEQNLANLTRVTDVLVRAGTLANATVEQFSTSLTTKAAAAARNAGQSLETTVAVLAAFADQGIKGARAGEGFAIILRDLQAEALDNEEAFAALGVEVFDQANNMNNVIDIVGQLEASLGKMAVAEKQAALEAVGFTKKNIGFIQSLFGTTEKMRGFEESLKNAGGAAKEVAEQQLKAFNEQLGLVKARVIDAAITLGQALMPIVLDLVDALDPLVELLVSATEWFGNLPPSVQMVIVGFFGLLAAAGVVLSAFGFIAQGIAGLIAAWPLLVLAIGKAATWIAVTAIPAITAAFGAMATFITGTAVPAVMAFATAALPFLGWAIAAAAAGFVAFELTSWVLEITEAQPVLDSFADSLFNVQRNAEGFSMPSFLSKEDITLIELAEDTLGRVFTRTAEGRREAVAAMHEYRTAARESAVAAEIVANATNENFDALTRTAGALGITKTKFAELATRLGMTSEELLLDKKLVELVGKELKKMAGEAAAADKRLRGMVKTHKDAQKDANLLAKAIKLEGGAIALTNAETMRIAALVAAWREENVELDASLEDVAKRAEEMARAEREAAIAVNALVMAEVSQKALQDSLDDSIKDLGEAVETDLVIPFNKAEEGLHVLALVLGKTDDEMNVISGNTVTFGEVLGTVGDVAWQLSGIFGGAFDQIVSSISSAITAGENLARSLKAQDLAGAVGAVASGAMALAEAVEGGGAMGIARGAATGAAMGASVGGAYGAAIGGAIGAIWGWLSEDVGKGAGEALGRGISEALEKTIKQTKDLFKDFGPDQQGISTAGAALLHLGNAMREYGGAAGFGMQETKMALETLIDFTVRGVVPFEQGLGAINDAFAQMAASAVEGGTIASRELFEVMVEAEKLGEDGVAAIEEFRAAMTAQAVVGVTAVVGEKIEGKGRAEPTFGGIQIVTEEDAAAQAEIFNTTFFAAVEEMGIRQAVEAMGPAFDVLKEKIEGFGAADLSGIQRFFDIARDPQFGPLLDGVQGLSDALAGAANAGFLTNDMFFAIQSQGQSAFDQLKEAGLTSQEAFQQMAPLLQNIIDASIEYGIPIDANTAALIEQAEANGIAFSTDPQQVMVDALMIIAELLGATEEQLNNIGKSAEDAGGEFGELENSATGSLEETASTAEGSAKEIEQSYADMSLNVRSQFDNMREGAGDEMETISGLAAGTATAVAEIGLAAVDSALDFDKMAEAARGVSTAVNTIDLGNGNGNGDRHLRMQHGGVVTEPTIALIGEAGPEAVVPLTGVPGIAAAGAAAEVEPVPAGGEGVQTRVIQLVLDRRVLFEVVEDGTRQGELRIHERSFQRFGD